MLKSRKIRLFDYLETFLPNIMVEVKMFLGKSLKKEESYTMLENTDEELLQAEVVRSEPILEDDIVVMHLTVRKQKIIQKEEGAEPK